MIADSRIARKRRKIPGTQNPITALPLSLVESSSSLSRGTGGNLGSQAFGSPEVQKIKEIIFNAKRLVIFCGASES
jgi:hypothetical protein